MKERFTRLYQRAKAYFAKPLSLTLFALVLSAITLVLFHKPLFDYVTQHIESDFNGTLILATIFIAILAANFLLYYLLLYLGRIVGRIIIGLLFIGNGMCLYFINSYEVLITSDMMGNFFNTRSSEAAGFVSANGIMLLIAVGLLPALYTIFRRVNFGSFPRFLINIAVSVVALIGVAASNINNILWIDQNATCLGSLIMPWSYTVNTARYFYQQYLLNREEIKLPDATITNQEREVVVLVIGESARRDHFSLYGYSRETNPLLKGDSVVTLKANASATFTTDAVKAILDYKQTEELYEILPNYLHRTGVDVVWRSTNWGEPPVHIDNYYNLAALKKRYPEANGKYDGILIEGLKEEIEACEGPKVLIVLHTSTSHGPEYYAKYPEEFNQFTPVCTTVEMSKADRKELNNAYDNTILYTDYLLHSVIETLRDIEGCRSTMIYISDHGESLGEGNRYMHGLPMMVAPKEQTEIPFIVWCSDGEQRIKPLKSVGHHHIFHSVLNFLHIDSPIYNESKNIFE